MSLPDTPPAPQRDGLAPITSWPAQEPTSKEALDNFKASVLGLMDRLAATGKVDEVGRAFHNKSHFSGQVKVRLDDNLDPRLTTSGPLQGKTGKELTAALRLSNAQGCPSMDSKPDVRGLALKLEDMDLILADSISFAKDARQFKEFVDVFGKQLTDGPYNSSLDLLHKLTHGQAGLGETALMMGTLALHTSKPVHSMTRETFWSQPIQLGSLAGRIRVEPAPKAEPHGLLAKLGEKAREVKDFAVDLVHPDHLRRNLARELQEGPVKMRMVYEAFTDHSALEDATVRGEFVDIPLGGIEIPQRDQRYHDSPKGRFETLLTDAMRFNPGKGAISLGTMDISNRVPVYSAAQDHRLALHDEDPKVKAFFSGRNAAGETLSDADYHSLNRELESRLELLRQKARELRAGNDAHAAITGQPGPDTLRRAPTVKGHPLLRNGLDILEQPIGFFVDACHKHGPVFQVVLPTERHTVISGMLAAELLKMHPGCPMNREGLFRPFKEEVGVSVFDLDGESHAHVRDLLCLPYSRQIVSQFVPEMEQWVETTVSFWNPNEILNLMEVSAKLAIYTMMDVVTPVNLQAWEPDFHAAGNRAMYTQFHVLPHIALRDPSYVRARDRMRKIIDEVIERHQAGEFAGHSKTYMIDACLRSISRAGDRMDKKTIRGVCFYALAGSEIYLGRLVCFMIYELLKNRRFLNLVLSEIDATQPGPALAHSFRRMSHLRAAYFETLRCYPLIPGFCYRATEDLSIAGYHIPAGEKLVFAPYLAHFSHEHFPNPTVFQPERHLPQHRDCANPVALSPFGVGGHACAAPGMVEILVLTLVVSLLRQVDLELERPSHQMSLRLAPLIAPKESVEIRVRGRRTPVTRKSFFLREVGDFAELLERTHPAVPLPHKEPEEVSEGQWIVHQGMPAEEFFVLLEGCASIWKTALPSTAPTRLEECLPGSSFGDMGLLKAFPSPWSVKIEKAGKILRFSAAEFEELVSRRDLTAHDLGSLYYSRYINSLLRSSLPRFSDAFSVESMSWKTFAKGELVFRQGDQADLFYILVEGAVEVIFERPTGPVAIKQLGPGDFFGEIGILNYQPRTASIRALKPLKTLCIERAVFLETVGQSPAALSDLALTVCQRLLVRMNEDC